MKEVSGKFMKNALYVQQYGKGTSQAEVTSNSEKFKPIIALAIVKLCESECISQSGRY